MKKKTTMLAAVLAASMLLTACTSPRGYVSEIEDTDEWEDIKAFFIDEYDEDGSEEEIWEEILEYVAEEEDEEVLKMSGEDYWDFLVDYYEDCLEDALEDANQAAAQVRNNTTAFLTKIYCEGISMANEGDITIELSIDKDGDWVLSGANGGNDWMDNIDHWGTESTEECDNKETVCVDYMKDMLSDLENCYVKLYFSNRKCIGVVFVPLTDSEPDVALPTLEEFKNGTTSAAFEDDAGLSEDVVVGTSPALGVAD